MLLKEQRRFFSSCLCDFILGGIYFVDVETGGVLISCDKLRNTYWHVNTNSFITSYMGFYCGTRGNQVIYRGDVGGGVG